MHLRANIVTRKAILVSGNAIDQKVRDFLSCDVICGAIIAIILKLRLIETPFFSIKTANFDMYV